MWPPRIWDSATLINDMGTLFIKLAISNHITEHNCAFNGSIWIFAPSYQENLKKISLCPEPPDDYLFKVYKE